MVRFKIKIDQDALADIQNATDWYNSQLVGLGGRFQKQVKSQINALKINALSYGIRYHDVRCALVAKFPFLIHFTIDTEKKLVTIFAVIHCSRRPKIWKTRRGGPSGNI